jgi:hypothetical protein
MLPNEEFAIACRAYYDEQGLVVDKRNGQFAHSPLTRTECETGYYLLWEHHQHQGLIQSRDLGKRCFWSGHAKQWLLTCDYWPENFFDLWDIYDEYTKPKSMAHLQSVETVAKRAATRSNQMKGIMPVEMIEKRKKKVEVTHPGGDTCLYSSVSEASQKLKLPRVTLLRLNNSGKTKSYGVCEGISVRFL